MRRWIWPVLVILTLALFCGVLLWLLNDGMTRYCDRPDPAQICWSFYL